MAVAPPHPTSFESAAAVAAAAVAAVAVAATAAVWFHHYVCAQV